MKILQTINRFNNIILPYDAGLLAFRVIIASQLIIVHGLKKVGIGTGTAEVAPNPFDLPDAFNQVFAIASNLIFPLFVIIGWYTRLAIIPILAVTLSGYFVVHWNDSLLEKDIPFMYSVAFLFIAYSGPGKYSIDRLLAKNSYL